MSSPNYSRGAGVALGGTCSTFAQLVSIVRMESLRTELRSLRA